MFLLYAKLRAIETYWKLFLKTKRGLGLISLPHFLHNFWRKIFLLLYFINWPSFTVWLPLLREILVNMCIAIVCWPGCDVMRFAVNFIFLVKLFFLYDQKVLNILRTKKAFKMKQKAFFIIFKALSMKQITVFLKGESPTLNNLWEKIQVTKT